MNIEFKKYTALNDLTKARVMVDGVFVGVVRANGCLRYFETVPTAQNGLTHQRSNEYVDNINLERGIRLMVTA